MRMQESSLGRALRSGFVLSRHLLERCEERSIPLEDVLHVAESPFMSVPAPDGENRWHFGPTRFGRRARWAWLKVVEGTRDGRRTLVTTYRLRRDGYTE